MFQDISISVFLVIFPSSTCAVCVPTYTKDSDSGGCKSRGGEVPEAVTTSESKLNAHKTIKTVSNMFLSYAAILWTAVG